MNKTWILVAHRSGARLFENVGRGKGLSLVEEIPHPEGRLKDGQINADKPGRAFDTFSRRHSVSQEKGPSDQVTSMFAKRLGDMLDKARTQNRFTKLVLVADPHLLGELRAALNNQTTVLVTATLNKDLANVESRDLPKHLGGVVEL
jgi:protein required for attachment to host cells